MIIKPAVFTILVIFLSLSDSKPSYRKCGNFVGVMADKKDCGKYYLCSRTGIAVPKTCDSGYYFHPEYLLCLSKEEFTAEELAKCEKNVQDDDNDLALPSSRGEVEWRNDPDENSKMKRNSLPNQIRLMIPIGTKQVNLHMKIQPQIAQNLKIVTNDKGKPERWEAPAEEEWDVYSDIKNKASLSVALKKAKSKREIIYDGSFDFENQTYSIVPLAKRFLNPIKKDSASKIVINGTSFLLIKEDIKNPVYELNSGRQARLSGDNSTTTSLMTDLERIVNQNFQALSAKRNFGVELLIVIDYSIFYKWYIRSTERDEMSKRRDAITNIRYYYTHIVNGINDRYSSIKEADMEFYVKLVGYFIAQSPTDASFTENDKRSSKVIDPYRSLDRFQAWVDEQRNSPINPLPNFDSAALFTSYDMLTSNNRLITGLADIGATCKPNAVSINKDQLQYATIGTGAHELGHNLGALHDDPNLNSCIGTDQYIMASAPGGFNSNNFFNAYKFSPCSIDSFRRYIATLDSENNNCLLNAAVDPDPGSTSYFLQTFPGQKYPIDEQCKLLYGPSSFYCAGGGESDERLCRELICYDPLKQKCMSKVEIRALDGTPCGNQKWCYRSTCQYNAKAPSKPENNCIYGDFKDSFNHNGRTTTCENHVQINKASCYSEYFKDKCCEACSKAHDSLFPTCAYGDKNSICSSRSILDCYDANIKEQCCEFCRKQEKKHLPPGCEYGDRASWCNSINPASCYQSDTTCCEFCAQNAKDIPNCKYGDKTPGCTLAHCSSPSHREGCCFTCRNTNAVPTTTTTTTPRPKYPNECPNGNTASWCNTIQKSDCYARKSECCDTCMGFADPSNTGCEYGDKWSNCREYVRGVEDCLRSDIRQNCCESCKPFITPNSDPPECDEGNQVHFCQNLKPWECYAYKKTCCKTCQQYFNPRLTGCEYGDKVSWCASYITTRDHCNRPEVAELCCKYCDSIKKTFDDDDELEDKAPWCKTMFAGYCYQPQVEETCAASCNKHRNNRSGDCRYGNFYDWCHPQYCSTNKKECCESCA